MRENEMTEIQLKNEIANGRTEFKDYLFADISLKGCNIHGVVFEKCTFMDCKFECCDMDEYCFRECSIYSTDFRMCSLKNVHFNDTHIGARFKYCMLLDGEIYNSWFKGGYIISSDMGGAKLTAVTFDGTWAENISMFSKPMSIAACSYTMGGATHEEVQAAKKRFFGALNHL